jgi:hypothetical protein
MPQITESTLISLLVLAGILLSVLVIKFWAPVPINESWVGTTFYVFNHTKSIAQMAPIQELNSNKKRNFFIPESFWELESRKTYELLEDEEGDLYFKQVSG